MSKKVSNYEGTEVDVAWDGRLCIHFGECGRANNEMFTGGRQPWCVPDEVDGDEARDVVERCPTGALSYVSHGDGPQESADDRNVIVVANNGPLYLRGELNIDGAADDMPAVKFRAALCRCGLSDNKPFCDNSHEKGDFRDHGAVGSISYEPLNEEGGELTVNPSQNGPLLLKGNVTIMASTGRKAWQGTKCALCRCGQSQNKPFCDGSHKRVGFQTE